MSETRPLKDKLKNAPEVTSLASTDRLMVVGNDGSPAKISIANAVTKNSKVASTFSGNKSRWITIAQIGVSEAWGGILTVSSGLWSGDPALHVFALGGRYSNGTALRPVIQSLLGPTSNVSFRIVVLDTSLRLDYKCYSMRAEVNSMGHIPLMTPIEADAIPADATVWQYDFSTSVFGISGGGKTLPFNRLRNFAERRVA